jgi:DNA repair protein RecO (recombination protein O)
MGAGTVIDTEGLALRKSPYSESSVIIAVLSPEHGQLHLLAKGARRTSRRAFPQIDLFRRLQLTVRRATRSDLHTVVQAECLTAYDGVASGRKRYASAQWLARFLLANTPADMPQPDTYAAACNTCDTLATGTAEGWAALVPLLFVYLAEHGLLPDRNDWPEQAAAIERLQQAALAAERPPIRFTEDAWKALAQWMQGYLNRCDLRCPAGWDELGI